MKLLIGSVLVFLLVATLPIPTMASTTSSITDVNAYLTPYHQSWIDNFNVSTVDNRWTWMREDSNLWSLTANPGNMQITSSGSLFQTSNNQKNILLTSAPDGDYRITTRVQVSPSENYNGAALYVYQDDDNYIELTRIYSDGPNVALRTEVGGVTLSSYVSVTQDDILLRIIKEGNVYYAWFSEDHGSTWHYLDQFSANFTNPKVGLGVRMGPSTTPLTADFDFIQFENYMEKIFVPFVVN
ncbi:MAG: DUF1349 domain-containing protein [Anaerolineales bacterium]